MNLKTLHTKGFGASESTVKLSISEPINDPPSSLSLEIITGSESQQVFLPLKDAMILYSNMGQLLAENMKA